MIRDLLDPIGVLSTDISRPPCKQCLEREGIDPETDQTAAKAYLMEPDQAYHPRLCAHVDVWACPECGREVLREELDEVAIHDYDPEEMEVSRSRVPPGWWEE